MIVGTYTNDYQHLTDLRPLGLYRYEDLTNTRTTMFFYHCPSTDHTYTEWFVCFMIYPDKWSMNPHSGPGQWWPVKGGETATVAKVFNSDKSKNLRRSSPLEFLLVTGKAFREEDVRK